jgi:hypothetical protein
MGYQEFVLINKKKTMKLLNIVKKANFCKPFIKTNLDLTIWPKEEHSLE